MSEMKILVFAGPNGSGKSSIEDCYDQEGLYINAYEILIGIDTINPC